MHDTPLAALYAARDAGIEEPEQEPQGAEKDGTEGARDGGSPAYLKLPEHLLYVGRAKDGGAVYAVWARTDGKLVPRLIASFCDVYGIEPEQCRVNQVPPFKDLRLQAAAVLYRIGLPGAATVMLRGWQRRGRLSLALAGRR